MEHIIINRIVLTRQLNAWYEMWANSPPVNDISSKFFQKIMSLNTLVN